MSRKSERLRTAACGETLGFEGPALVQYNKLKQAMRSHDDIDDLLRPDGLAAELGLVRPARHSDGVPHNSDAKDEDWGTLVEYVPDAHGGGHYRITVYKPGFPTGSTWTKDLPPGPYSEEAQARAAERALHHHERLAAEWAATQRLVKVDLGSDLVRGRIGHLSDESCARCDELMELLRAAHEHIAMMRHDAKAAAKAAAKATKAPVEAAKVPIEAATRHTVDDVFNGLVRIAEYVADADTKLDILIRAKNKTDA